MVDVQCYYYYVYEVQNKTHKNNKSKSKNMLGFSLQTDLKINSVTGYSLVVRTACDNVRSGSGLLDTEKQSVVNLS